MEKAQKTLGLMMKQSKGSRLNELIKSLKQECHYEFEAKYIPHKGWYLMPLEPRWFNDSGEYMGYTFAAAKRNIEVFLKLG